MAQTKPQTYWDVTMMEAQQAYAHRQWATLDALLDQARCADDAPAVYADADWEREGVQAWHALSRALGRHQYQAHTLVCAAMRIVIRRTQDRYGATGAPDPTSQELWTWLLEDVEELDMAEVEEAAEGRRREDRRPVDAQAVPGEEE